MLLISVVYGCIIFALGSSTGGIWCASFALISFIITTSLSSFDRRIGANWRMSHNLFASFLLQPTIIMYYISFSVLFSGVVTSSHTGGNIYAIGYALPILAAPSWVLGLSFLLQSESRKNSRINEKTKKFLKYKLLKRGNDIFFHLIFSIAMLLISFMSIWDVDTKSALYIYGASWQKIMIFFLIIIAISTSLCTFSSRYLAGKINIIFYEISNISSFLSEASMPLLAFLFIYILQILFFGSTYFIVDNILSSADVGDPNIFSGRNSLYLIDYIYYSLVVATTVGFGDITPVNRIIRGVTMAQMVISLAIVLPIFGFIFERARAFFEANPRPQEPDGTISNCSPHPQVGVGGGRA